MSRAVGFRLFKKTEKCREHGQQVCTPGGWMRKEESQAPVHSDRVGSPQRRALTELVRGPGFNP